MTKTITITQPYTNLQLWYKCCIFMNCSIQLKNNYFCSSFFNYKNPKASCTTQLPL